MTKRLIGCLLLLLCAACATPQAQQRVQSVISPGFGRDGFETSDGTYLPYRAWLPHGETTAVIVALHGFNDYSHAFEIPGEYMRMHGVATYAYDQRGFGSAPARGLWAGEYNLVHDAADMVNLLHAQYPHVPVYLLGESMGGAVAVAAATAPGFPKIDGVILSSPALWGGETMNPIFRMSLWLFAHTVPGKVMTGQDLHILASDNIDMLRALGNDSQIIKATRVDAVWGLVQLMDKGYDNVVKVKVPTLLLYGAHDQVIPPEPIRKVLQKAPLGTVGAYYPLGYHMLLRDLHGDVPVRDILAWMKRPAAPLPSGFDAAAKRFSTKK